MRIEFRVIGQPATEGSKRAIPFRKKSGKLGVNVVADNKRSTSWRETVRDAATRAIELRSEHDWLAEEWSVYGGPIKLHCTFYKPRPKSHYRTGRYAGHLKPNAAALEWIAKPDGCKLIRAIEDALTGIVWRDDSQIVAESWRKTFVPMDLPWTTYIAIELFDR